jgi:cobalt-zinc-cadmium efflux system protein
VQSKGGPDIHGPADHHGSDHKHHAGHHGHHHAAGNAPGQQRALLIALLLTASFAIIEALGGWYSGSLALLSDAGHMLSDALALGMAALAARLASRPPSARHSYGLVRAEVLAAAFNALLMLAVILAITVESVQRLLHPEPVAGGPVMVIAGIGLLVNVITAVVLARAGNGLNVRAALLHVLGDLLGSVAALAAGAIILFTGWLPADPLLSLLVVLGILVSTLRLLGEAVHVLMEGVPHSLDLDQVGHGMAAIVDVRGVHDLHIWMLASGQTALSAHIDIERLDCWPKVLRRLRSHLADRHDIRHVTLQPETPLPAPLPGRAHIPIHPAAARTAKH